MEAARQFLSSAGWEEKATLEDDPMQTLQWKRSVCTKNCQVEFQLGIAHPSRPLWTKEENST